MSRDRRSTVAFALWLHDALARDADAQPPTIDHLARLIEELIWTSIEAEEGRGIKCSVLFVPHTHRAEKRHSRLEFKSPLPYTSATLQRLGPATDATSTFLEVGLIVPDTGGEAQLRICGLVRLSALEVSARASSSLQALPKWDAFNLRIGGPGVLHAYRGNARMGTYSKGEILPESPSSLQYRFEHVLPAELWTKELIESTGISSTVSYRRDMSLLYLNALVALLRRIEELGYGGTLLMIPRDLTMDAVGRVRYEASPPYSGMEQAVGEALRAFVENRVHDAWPEVDNQARLIADFSGSDGAVLIDHTFRFHGAGVELTTQTDGNEEITVVDANVLADFMQGDADAGSCERLDSSGMRHRSAVSFVKQTKGSIAFVVSQDGGVTVACRPIRPHLTPADAKSDASAEVLRVTGFRVWATHGLDE